MITETPIHYTIAWFLKNGDPLMVAPLATQVNNFVVAPANDAEAMSLARLAIIDTGVTEPLISAFAVDQCEGCRLFASAVPFDMEEAVESDETSRIVDEYVSNARLVGEVYGLPMFGTGMDGSPELDELMGLPSEEAWQIYSRYLQHHIETTLADDLRHDGATADRFSTLWVDFCVKAHRGFIYLMNDGSHSTEGMDALIDGEITMDEYNKSLPIEAQMSMFAQAQELKSIPNMIRASVVRAAAQPVLHRSDILGLDDIDNLITALEEMLRDRDN